MMIVLKFCSESFPALYCGGITHQRQIVSGTNRSDAFNVDPVLLVAS